MSGDSDLGPSPGDDIDSIQSDATSGMSLPWGDGSARTWVLGILVGAFLGLFEATLGQFISAGGAVTGALEETGAAFSYAGGRLSTAVLDVMSIPFDVAALVAASAGPFAPVVVAVAWALAAASTGLFLYILWRVFTWI